MSEITDLVMPVLQRMQGDIAATRHKTDAMAESVSAVKDKLESLESLITWNLGRTSEGKHAIETLQSKVKELEQRITGLESRF